MLGSIAALIVLPFVIIVVAVITMIIIAVYTSKEKKLYHETAATYKAQVPVVINDKNTVKVQYRMNLMDDFVRGTFKDVRSWKMIGDDDFHSAYFDKDWDGDTYLKISFLDGREKTVKIWIDPYTDTISMKQKEKVSEGRDEDTSTSTATDPCDDSLKEILNAFLKRNDVYDILSNEKNGIITEDLPDDTIFPFLEKYLMEEFGAQLVKAPSGWSIFFT